MLEQELEIEAEPSESEPRPSVYRRVSVVVPTFREVENIPELVRQLSETRESHQLDLELILVDDDSRDGSEELVKSLALRWVQMIVRKEERGLSSAVLAGLRRASHELLLVMDGDLSHPTEKIPEMLAALQRGADFVVGSRFVEGGTTDDDWGIFRWLNSRVATLLALPLAPLKDPMSGFFALRKSTFARSEGSYNPIGYKIGLELLVRANCKQIVEVPIHFTDRRHGQSKLTLREQLRYLQHIRRLYIHRYGNWSHLVQFGVVGLSGAVVNMVALLLALHFLVPDRPAVALAIGVSMIWNFALNRRFSFSYARHQNIFRQFLGFVAACSVGALVNYGVTTGTLSVFPHPLLASAAGIAAGMAFNFIANRFVVFRKRHVQK